MFKLNQNGISLIEVMVAAGISSVIALGTMKINENAQKGMRSVATKAELSSYISQRFPNMLEDNAVCLAAWDVNNDGNPGDNINLAAGNTMPIAGIYANGITLAETGERLPSTSGEYNVDGLTLSRINDTSCEVIFDLSRNDNAAGANKIGARNKRERVPLACSWNGAPNLMISCSTESTALGRWDYDTIGGVEWLENPFKSAVIGDYDTAGPDSPSPPARFVITPNAVSTPWGIPALMDAVGIPANYVVRWGNERAEDNGVGMWGQGDCINLATAGNAGTPFMETCDAAGTTIRNSLTVESGGLTVTAGGADITGNTDVNGNLHATGTGRIDGATDINNTLTVDGLTTINHHLVVAGANRDLSVGRNATITRDLTVGRHADIDDDLSVGRDATITRDLAVNRHLNVDDNLTVNGSSTHNSGLTVTGGLANLNNGLTVNGAVTNLNNGLSVNSSNTSLGGSLAVSGTASVNNTIYTVGEAVFDGGFRSFADSEVHGNLWVSGTVTSSDVNLKEEIKPIDKSLESILSLQPVRYFWKDRGLRGEKEQFGFIAQEVQTVYPELVSENKDGNFLGVNYVGLIAPIVDSIKTLYFKIAKLFSEVEDNQREIASIKEENKKLKAENEELKKQMLRIEKALNLE
tara:strand:+ start:153542 stop:155455 length:1914 start_codon:yes stop_codon:yes gene_type:complete